MKIKDLIIELQKLSIENQELEVCYQDNELGPVIIGRVQVYGTMFQMERSKVVNGKWQDAKYESKTMVILQ